MQWFILRRFSQSFMVLIVVVTATFLLARVVGDPALTLLPQDATKEDYERLKKHYGLDKPMYIQYFSYMGALAKGDLGESVIRVGYKVTDLLWRPLGNSAKLALAAFLFAFGAALPMGIIAALNRGKPLDWLMRLFASLGLCMPGWWMGMIMIILFAVQFRLLPVAGTGDIKHYILPAIALGHGAAAGLSRLIRSTMLDVLDSEYIKMARAKGLPWRVVVWKHAVRNAMIPMVTFGGLYLAFLITGALTIEVVFAWPGMGRLLFESIGAQDRVVVQSLVLVAATIIVTANFLVDIAYGIVDPRIRLT